MCTMVRHFVVSNLEARVLRKELIALVTGCPDASSVLDSGRWHRRDWTRSELGPDASGI